MKKLLLITVLSLGLTQPGWCGPLGDRLRARMGGGQAMQQLLGLTSEQQARIQPIVKQAAEQLKSLDQGARKTQRMTIMLHAAEQIKPILTEQQRIEIGQLIDRLR